MNAKVFFPCFDIRQTPSGTTWRKLDGLRKSPVPTPPPDCCPVNAITLGQVCISEIQGHSSITTLGRPSLSNRSSGLITNISARRSWYFGGTYIFPERHLETIASPTSRVFCASRNSPLLQKFFPSRGVGNFHAWMRMSESRTRLLEPSKSSR